MTVPAGTDPEDALPWPEAFVYDPACDCPPCLATRMWLEANADLAEDAGDDEAGHENEQLGDVAGDELEES